MAMIVQHNLTAMNSNRMLGITTGAQAKSTEKLSSGYRINRAADDAAGLTISEKMRKQIRGLDQASTNAQDGVSSVQTAEGALTEVHSMLQRMNELAVQASNGTNSEGDRQAIQDEIDQLTTEIDRVAETTKFNEIYLLKGDKGTKTITMEAHDAGLKGVLTPNGDGTAIFKMDEVKAGDKVAIGGKNYTIGVSTDETDKMLEDAFEAADADPNKAEDIVINGKTYKYMGTAGGTDANENNAKGGYYEDGKWAQGAGLDADGLKALATIGSTVKVGEKELKSINDEDANGVDDNDSSVITADKAYALAKEELLAANKIGDTNGVADVQGFATADDFKAGDTVSIEGTNYTIGSTADDMAKKLDELVKAADAGTDTTAITVEVDNVTYTYTPSGTPGAAGAWSDDSGTSSLSAVNAAIKAAAGKEIEIAGGAAGKTDIVNGTYTMADDATAGSTTISAAKAAELKNAEVGITNPNEFKITMGTADVAETLSFNLHVGADADMTNKIQVDIDTMNSAGLGVKGLNVVDDSGIAATYAIDSIADAVGKVSAQRSALGAVQNRLEHTIANVDNVVENTTAAESRIRDTNMAEEMVEYSKNNILAQAGQAMLAQANQSNQGVLSLLG